MSTIELTPGALWRIFVAVSYASVMHLARERRGGILLVVVTAMMLASSFVDPNSPAGFLLGVTALLVLSASVLFISGRRHLLIPTILLGTLFLLGEFARAFAHPMPVVEALYPFAIVPFYAVLIAALFSYVFGSGHITRDKILGAMCVYVLLGHAFAGVYKALDSLTLEPLFSGAIAFGANKRHPYADLVYFSFVTLTTLGYGDIVPLGRPTRIIAILEAIAGVMFLGTLIARLVSAYHAPTRADEDVAGEIFGRDDTDDDGRAADAPK